jgi:hypothetical protein
MIFISYMIYNHIWLNLPRDDWHLGYIANSLKKY